MLSFKLALTFLVIAVAAWIVVKAIATPDIPVDWDKEWENPSLNELPRPSTEPTTAQAAWVLVFIISAIGALVSAIIGLWQL